MANTTKLAEFAKLYYQIQDYDIETDWDTTGEAAALADELWKELCVISVSPSSNVNNYEVKDRCTGNIVGNAPGRESYTFDVSMNMFRLPDDEVRAWHAAMDDPSSIIAFMGLNDDRTELTAWGFIGNFTRIDESEDQPEEGLMTVSYTFGPAAGSQYLPLKRRIYGSGIA